MALSATLENNVFCPTGEGGGVDPTCSPPGHKAQAAKALKIAREMIAEWQSKLDYLGVKVVLGGSLVSGLTIPGQEMFDADVRFLYDGDRKTIIPEIEKVTGLKYKKSIIVGGGPEPESNGHMIEGKRTIDGISFDIEGALRSPKHYTGWAEYYQKVLSPTEIQAAIQRKSELAHDKPAYKAYKADLLKEVQKRVAEKGINKPAEWSSGKGGLDKIEKMSHPTVLLGGPPVSNERLSGYLEKNGKEYTKIAESPKDMGKEKECYKNSTDRMIFDESLDYVEGIAYRHSVGPSIGFLHAWNVDKDGNVIDSTWEDNSKDRYFGVKYDRKKYMAHVIKTRMYGVLGGDYKGAQKVVEKGGL